MANQEHLAVLKLGSDALRKWRSENPDSQLDFAGAYMVASTELGGTVDWTDTVYPLPVANTTNVNLQGVDLTGADLRGCILHLANLAGASLRGATLNGANLFGLGLAEADLQGVDLSHCTLRHVNLSGADLTDATMNFTVLSGVDLSGVKGIDRIRHKGPSSVGVDTLYASKGALTELFLRGTGMPDGLVTYARSLVGEPFEFYSCFISYSTKDQDFADRLYTDLQARGIRCWFAPNDAQAGQKIHEQIDRAIQVHDRLLLILSEHSMKSEWVKTEIGHARQKELNQKRQVLFPISLVPFSTIKDWKCFDADTGKDSAREIREYFIPDFSRWKDHDSYQRAFQRLIRDLSAPEKVSPRADGE